MSWLKALTDKGGDLIQDAMAPRQNDSSRPMHLPQGHGNAPADLGSFFKDLLTTGPADTLDAPLSGTPSITDDIEPKWESSFIDPQVMSLSPIDPTKPAKEATPPPITGLSLHELLQENEDLYQEGITIRERVITLERRLKDRNERMMDLEIFVKDAKLKEASLQSQIEAISGISFHQKVNDEIDRVKRESRAELEVLRESLMTSQMNARSIGDVTSLHEDLREKDKRIVDLEERLEGLLAENKSLTIDRSVDIPRSTPLITDFSFDDFVPPTKPKNDEVREQLKGEILQLKENIKLAEKNVDSYSQRIVVLEEEIAEKEREAYRNNDIAEAEQMNLKQKLKVSIVKVETLQKEIEAIRMNNQSNFAPPPPPPPPTKSSLKRNVSEPDVSHRDDSRTMLSHRPNVILAGRKPLRKCSTIDLKTDYSKVLMELETKHQYELNVAAEKLDSSQKMVAYLHDILLKKS